MKVAEFIEVSPLQILIFYLINYSPSPQPSPTRGEGAIKFPLPLKEGRGKSLP
jgi:hypothetical protein